MTKARDIASAAPAPSTVSATEIGYLDGVSSAIQTQIDGKSSTSHNHNSDYIAKTLTTTTGDIIYASSANNPARLGIGSTGQVLTVSGGVPTWAAGGTAFSGSRVYSSVDPYNIANDSPTAVDFDSEAYDVGGYHSVSSNTSRFTIPSGKAGYYLVQGQVSWIHNTSGKRQIDIYKNGTGYATGVYGPSVASSPGDWPTCPISSVIYLAVGDYVTMVVTQKSGGTIKMINGSDSWTWFQITYLGA